MFVWLLENIATIIVCIGLLAAVAACFQYDTKQEKRQIPLWLRMHKLLRTRLLPQGEMKIATDGNIRNCMPIFVGIVLSQISLIWVGSVWRDFQSPEEQCFYCTGVAV